MLRGTKNWVPTKQCKLALRRSFESIQTYCHKHRQCTRKKEEKKNLFL